MVELREQGDLAVHAEAQDMREHCPLAYAHDVHIVAILQRENRAVISERRWSSALDDAEFDPDLGCSDTMIAFQLADTLRDTEARELRQHAIEPSWERHG